jgi:hypothetical protein
MLIGIGGLIQLRHKQRSRFLTIYRRFLLEELAGHDEAAQQDVLRVLGHTCYDYPEIILRSHSSAQTSASR